MEYVYRFLLGFIVTLAGCWIAVATTERDIRIADFFRDHLTDDADVHIKDAQNFCCNAWR